MNASQLIAFEKSIADAFERGEIHCPVHLGGGNEDRLVNIFNDVGEEDWVFAGHRHNFHALLHGVPEDYVRGEIMSGRGMNLMSAEHRFFTSAIVGGILPIAVGVAAGIKRKGGREKVWCFIGDMGATMGVFHEAIDYAHANRLPINFIIEDNEVSTNTPTYEAWGGQIDESFIDHYSNIIYYQYKRTYPHCGIGKWVDL